MVKTPAAGLTANRAGWYRNVRMAEPTCHYCTRPAEEECPACGRLFCGDHGEDVCLRCSSPEAATPSAAVFRGSLVTLVVATVLAVFLIVRPPESKSTQDSVRTVATSTPAFAATATATRPGSATAVRSLTPAQGTQPAGTPSAGTTSPTAVTTGTPPATATATAGGERSYTVQPGDTLSAIAADFATTVAEIVALNPSLDPDHLSIGTVLKIPAAR
jgi:LysM repeat protein